MISKKNKALVASILAAGMSAAAIVPTAASALTTPSTTTNSNAKGSNGSYSAMFESLYDDVITNGEKSGYLSKQNNGGSSFGIPYHAVETLVVEAPDYGHETTSEAMSYIVWMASMHDVLAKKGLISGSTGDLAKSWKTLEAIVPGWSEASGINKTIKYNTIWTQTRLKADPKSEEPTPENYPDKQTALGKDALNPLFKTFAAAYSGDNGYYLMHWLADVDDWYGFGGGTPGAGTGKFTFINTFQRGEEESCFETVPQPCIEELKYGTKTGGIKAIFNGDPVPEQYAFTNAPDAEDRAIQAVYFANRYGAGSSDVSALAGKMGDQCRNDMFDKYYKAIGCQSASAPSDSDASKSLGNFDSQHYLMAWYTSWGGALETYYGGVYDWAWQIGCSHSHQFYQNPLAAYALLYDSDINKGMKSDGANADYEESLKRQIEMYQWLQSVDGPFAGGCTNMYNGRYDKYPSDLPTFYDMVFTAHPVYADPGSNHWIGNQVWSTQRLAELYYDVVTNGDKTNGKCTPGGLSLEKALDKLLERWIAWFEKNTKFDYVDEDGNKMEYAIPSTLDWGNGGHHTDSNCVPDTWKGTYNENGNQKLTCEIKGYGQGDIGCVSSLCNTLIHYAAAKKVDPKYAKEEGTSVAEKGLLLANKLLTAQYNLGRDDIGIAFKDHNGSLDRLFTQEVYIPSSYKGTMPDGSKLEKGATFSSIRESYKKDKMYQECESYYKGEGKDNNGDGKVDVNDFEYYLHRFWHHGDAIMAYGEMALLYPDVEPYDPIIQSSTSSESESEVKMTKWGDANLDKQVNIADAVLVMQVATNPDKYAVGKSSLSIKPEGQANADVDGKKGLTNSDALLIQQYKLGLYTPTL